jgi:hypothetical protein
MQASISSVTNAEKNEVAFSKYMEQRQLLLVFIYLQELSFMQRKSHVLCSSNYELHHLGQTGRLNLSHYKWHGIRKAWSLTLQMA